jgi:uncharacterized membrane-anchored protein YitT (DUF2179 family)
MLWMKKKKENIVKTVYKKDRFSRYIQFIVGVLIVAVSFNLFILPNNIVYGVGGIAVILNALFKYDPATVILIGSIFLLIMSYIFLGKEKTTNSILGSLMYPLFVKLTADIGTIINIGTSDPLVIAIFGAVISGFGLGLIFKAGFTTGGTDILNQIVSKYFKMSIGNAMFFTDGVIIMSGVFVFGWTKLMYSLLTLYIISVMADKVILGISQSKTFYIITDHETAIKKFITESLNHGVTILEARGGYTGDRQKVLMCTIPTKEYFIFKEGIHQIDKKAFFLAVDAYEVSGGE